jgi:hypothetical protein
MRFLTSLGLLFLFTVLVVSSCSKDEEILIAPTIDTTNGPTIPEPEEVVNASFSGLVIDKFDQAVENALVSFGTDTRLTDENGYFSFANVNIDTRGSLVSVEKEGYFQGAKFVGSKLNKQNFTSIKLIEKVQTGAFQANAGGVVATNDGATIEFAANAIKLENGGLYSGTVNVYATWLDPTADDLTQRMPGDLRAINAADEQQQLTTYGMIGVELEGMGGEPLNIAEGQTATISLPVPSELAASAPATIPLWHFDELTGYWIEEGEARLEGGAYVGTVSHFSFWNCDVPSDFIFIEGTIVDRDGNPLQNVVVQITQLTDGMSGYDITDEDGAFGGPIPANQELILTVFDNCGVVIFTETIGPFSEDTTLPTFSASVTDELVTVSGILIDCENNPVTNGYVKIDLGDSFVTLPTDSEGMISGTINVCDATTIEVTGFDLENLTQSEIVNVNVEDSTSIDLETIFVCEDLSEFLIFKIGELEIIDPDPTARYGLVIVNGVPGTYLTINGKNPETLNGFPIIRIRTVANAPGTYTPDGVFITYTDETPQTVVLSCEISVGEPCDAVTLEITNFSDIGGFITGSFSGILEPSGSSGTTQPVEGSFKIIREE